MTKFIGRLADIGIAKEAARGTAEASVDFYLPKVSLTIDDEIEQAIDESSIGVIEDSTNASVVAKYAEGEIEGNIYDKSFGLILNATLGTVGTTGPAQTTVYTHAFSVAQSAQHQSLTLFLDDGNQDYKYPLAVLASLELDFALGQYARYKAAFRSMKGATASLSPSYSAENHFLPQHAVVQYATTLAGLSSPTTVNVRSFKINIEKNIEDDRKLGSLDQSDILNKQLAVDGSIELVFDAETFKTQQLADTSLAMRVVLTNTDVTIGSSMNPKLTITLAKVKFSNFEKDYDNDGVVMATVDFKAHYSLSDTAMITAELINTQTSYA
jgi:hypothetical protein